MTDKATIDERVEKNILKHIGTVNSFIDENGKNHIPLLIKDLKSLLLEVVREVVGQEEESYYTPEIDIRNELRKEILEKVRGLCSK